MRLRLAFPFRMNFTTFPLIIASVAAAACTEGSVGGTGSGGTVSAGGGDVGGLPPLGGGQVGTGGSVSSGGRGTGGDGPAGGSDSGGRSSSGGKPETGIGGMEAAAGGAPVGGAPQVGGQSASGGGSNSVDVFGIRKLYPDGGAEWTSEHWLEGPYEVEFDSDPKDPVKLSGARGNGTLQVNSEGELIMSGSEPRIYIYPDDTHVWQDVEVTVYYERVLDEATAYSGLVVGVRSGVDGHTTEGACDAHTYYARLRHDGAIDFEKELKHPASSVKARVDPGEVWPPDGKLPFQKWIGWKFVIYNLDDSRVRLEAYRDLAEGVDGGNWELVNTTVDEGGWSVETDCAEHQPSGGQSDLVVLGGGAVLVRNTNVTEARYRALSVREITP